MVLVGIDYVNRRLTHEEEHTAACALRDRILRLCLDGDAVPSFAVRERGKPYIVGLDVTYSVSHTDGCIICAVCAEGTVEDLPQLFGDVSDGGIYAFPSAYPCEIGVDVERIDRERGKERSGSIAKRYYSDGERARLECAVDREAEFYRIWTAKESLVKCTGEGMRAIASADTACLEAGYEICELKLDTSCGEFAAALCLKRL